MSNKIAARVFQENSKGKKKEMGGVLRLRRGSVPVGGACVPTGDPGSVVGVLSFAGIAGAGDLSPTLWGDFPPQALQEVSWMF